MVAMTKLSMESLQDNVGVDSPTEPKVEDQLGTKNVDIPQSDLSGRPKRIQIRSGWVSHRSQRLGIMEEQ